MAESLYERAVRRIAEITGRDIKKAVDPDDADTRVGDDAQPTDKKLEAAGEEAAAGGQAGAGAEGGVPGDPGAGEGAGEGPGPDGSAEHEGGESEEQESSEQEGGDDDGEDMTPDEVRDLRKAFGLSDKDDLADIKSGTEIPALLKSILSYMQKSDAFQQNIAKEMADLKAKHASGKADEAMRVTMKSIDEKVGTLQSVIEGLHRTVPAAAQPKAVQKANPGSPEQPRLTLADITALSMKGEITAAEAARLTRMVNHNLTPA